MPVVMRSVVCLTKPPSIPYIRLPSPDARAEPATAYNYLFLQHFYQDRITRRTTDPLTGLGWRRLISWVLTEPIPRLTLGVVRTVHGPPKPMPLFEKL